MGAYVYKICDALQWHRCELTGALPRSADDARDGYVHLSSAAQVRESCTRHFAGRDDLWLLEVDPERLPDGALRWESSRGGRLFPHLYGELPRVAIIRASVIDRGPEGFTMPPWCPQGSTDAQPAAGGIDSTRTPEPPAKP